MNIAQIKKESAVMTAMPDDGPLLLGHASIVVPITLWRRMRRLLAMHRGVSEEMMRLEVEGRDEAHKKPVRASLIRDIAKADGNESHRMGTQTVETMYGGIADSILARYNVSVKKERTTNGTQSR